METNKKTVTIAAIAIVVIAGAVVARFVMTPAGLPPPDAGGFYYDGPMKAKGGSTYGNEAGQEFSKQDAKKALASIPKS